MCCVFHAASMAIWHCPSPLPFFCELCIALCMALCNLAASEVLAQTILSEAMVLQQACIIMLCQTKGCLTEFDTQTETSPEIAQKEWAQKQNAACALTNNEVN